MCAQILGKFHNITEGKKNGNLQGEISEQINIKSDI